MTIYVVAVTSFLPTHLCLLVFQYNTAQNIIRIIKLYNILITPTNLKFILIAVSNKK